VDFARQQIAQRRIDVALRGDAPQPRKARRDNQRAEVAAATARAGVAGVLMALVGHFHMHRLQLRPQPPGDALRARARRILRHDYSRWLRSIQAFFSCTSMRRTARSSLASSPAAAAAWRNARAASVTSC